MIDRYSDLDKFCAEEQSRIERAERRWRTIKTFLALSILALWYLALWYIFEDPMP